MRIGEVAEATGTTTKALRFYEEAGLLPSPERTGAGYRDYPPEIISRLAFIRRSQSAGRRATAQGSAYRIRLNT
jgi:DNA-binding transcriptional MerR regulator